MNSVQTQHTHTGSLDPNSSATQVMEKSSLLSLSLLVSEPLLPQGERK